MDIDAVITWVDGDDSRHASSRAMYSGTSEHPAATSATRFASRGELTYCVLSILQFCSFVRNIYIVTDGQTPRILKEIAARYPSRVADIQIVDHRVLYAEHADLLPVFSSRSIETMLHRIPSLREHFIYLNDDMFIGRMLEPSFFFRLDKPVLRGAFRPARPIFDWIKKHIGSGPRRPGFKEAQKQAGRQVGFSDRYFLAEHLPYAMRRSRLAAYYDGQEDALRLQAGHRFRSDAQVSPIGLTNHLELRDGAPYEEVTKAGYIKPPKNIQSWRRILQTLDSLKKGKLVALCIQSLDAFDDDDRMAVWSALDKYYNRHSKPTE